MLGGGSASGLRKENERLHACLAGARLLLEEKSPGGSAGLPGMGGCNGPLPFALFGAAGSSGDEGDGAESDMSPATTLTLPSPDVYASPLLAASSAALTVDFRQLSAGSGRWQVGRADALTDADSYLQHGKESFMLLP
jgi:hypothetical protein